MMGPAPPQSQSQLPSAAAPQSTATAQSSPEEEAIKRNTDCVYFLASPLTCKKGSECEYRHSDMARLNPRDCYYWLNFNCLNPKCAFRHPPLDGLFGNQEPNPVGFSQTPGHFAATPAANGFNSSGKQGVPCVFFQKGLCLKGDRCAFLHTPTLHIPPQNNKAVQMPGATSATEQATVKRPFTGLEKYPQATLVQQPNVQKNSGTPFQTKLASKTESAPPKNEYPSARSVPFASDIHNEPLSQKPTTVSPDANGHQVSRSNHVVQPHTVDDNASMNGTDTEEFSREPSPGFDVLVDDELRDSGYYVDEDQLGRTRGHEGRHEYDMRHPVDYKSLADISNDRYRDLHGYDSFDRLEGQYGWEQRRASVESVSALSIHHERRRHDRAGDDDRIDKSDLRHLLSKQRRTNGLRSVISHDYVRERRDDHHRRFGSRRVSPPLPSRESSLRNRLSGRIRMPGAGRSRSPTEGTNGRPRMPGAGRSRSPTQGSNGRPEMKLDTAIGRPQLSSHQGRLQDRIKGRVQEVNNGGGVNNYSARLRRGSSSESNMDFAGPKSLAELKSKKTSDSTVHHGDDHQLLGKRKYQNHESNQENSTDVSFEGPMPLEEILKRKRRVDKTAVGSTSDSGDDDKKQLQERLAAPVFTDNIPIHENEEESKHTSGDSVDVEAKTADRQSSLKPDAEDGMIAGEEGAVGEGPEGYDDQMDDEYDYEQVDGEEDYNLEDGETGDAEEEYLEDDDDDADDFAKKMGVVSS